MERFQDREPGVQLVVAACLVREGDPRGEATLRRLLYVAELEEARRLALVELLRGSAPEKDIRWAFKGDALAFSAARRAQQRFSGRLPRWA